jgi:hypothetical protein
MYRRGRRRRWLALAGVVVLVLGGFLIFQWIGGGAEPADAGAKTAAHSPDAAPAGQNAAPTTMADSGASREANKPNAKPKPQDAGAREQERISMGGRPDSGSPRTPPSQQPADSSKPDREASTASVTPPATSTSSDAAPPPALVRIGPGSAAPASPAPEAPAAGSSNNNQPAATPSSAASNASAQQRINLGLDLIKQNKPVEARRALTEALATNGISTADAERVRGELAKLNERLIFSPEVVPGDPFVSTHKIESGEWLEKLPRKLDLDVDWRFLQRINRISDPAKIQAGQRLKTVKGPFHAVVDKRAFRMDLYMGDGSERVFVRSFSVGLGEYGATPEGAFTVKPNSKLVDPAWTNPRTGEHFASGDPKNPIGKYWIGLIGASDNIRGLESYGIHGTIEPESVGQERSMGCVRMLADDIKLVYEVLMDNVSRVEIHGNDWP